MKCGIAMSSTTTFGLSSAHAPQEFAIRTYGDDFKLDSSKSLQRIQQQCLIACKYLKPCRNATLSSNGTTNRKNGPPFVIRTLETPHY